MTTTTQKIRTRDLRKGDVIVSETGTPILTLIGDPRTMSDGDRIFCTRELVDIRSLPTRVWNVIRKPRTFTPGTVVRETSDHRVVHVRNLDSWTSHYTWGVVKSSSWSDEGIQSNIDSGDLELLSGGRA